MNNTSLDLEQYILGHIDNEDPILAKLDRDTHANVLYSRMCSGHLQGSILTFLSKLIQPNRILELGTFTGYSAICLAKGLQAEGKLHTVEINDELEEFAYGYFELSGLSESIIQHIGNAETIIPDLDETFDLVFMDADKRRYVEHYELVIDKVRPGGVILADNTLWDGKVVEPISKNDLQTKGILAFNDYVKNDPRVETTILPLRDGITMLRKR
ncbi:O-methyltransferase [Halosquirtibacter xylanolyticus]|uniref:O-methyltransferase n=1 Tax=Halosquirtibacter xylanolyticus TaxID=3374599 RepID=UPI003748D663|nr:O-methyltransferase [Prolixibacteraceae bacterium]